MFNIRDIDASKLFAEDPTFDRIIQGYFGLNHLEFATFCSVYQLGNCDVQQIIDHLGEVWPRNKINTALKKLLENNLVNRKPATTKKKSGFKYIYSIIDVDLIKEEIISAIDKWLTLSRIELDNLEHHLDNYDPLQFAKMKRKRDKIREKWFKE